MVIGVMSDTHGNLKLMHRVADLMETRFRAEVIFHLGDDYCDAEELAEAGHPVRMVPGLWGAEYHDPAVPNSLIERFDGVSVACAHTDSDLQARERAAAVILTGHTHAARIEHIGFSLYVNPGHLSRRRHRRQEASFAIVTIGPREVTAAIYEATGEMRSEATISRNHLA